MQGKKSQRSDKKSSSLKILLRDIQESDLDIFFEQQKDPEANFMAAFTRRDPSDRKAFESHWKRITNDEKIKIQAIIWEGKVAGSVLSYVQSGETEVSYWIGREFWGNGIATAALSEFLDLQQERPLFARAAKDNLGSIRVLEKCGFEIIGYDRGLANARGKEIEEVVMQLD